MNSVERREIGCVCVCCVCSVRILNFYTKSGACFARPGRGHHSHKLMRPNVCTLDKYSDMWSWTLSSPIIIYFGIDLHLQCRLVTNDLTTPQLLSVVCSQLLKATQQYIMVL